MILTVKNTSICIACKSDKLHKIIDLGYMPNANRFVSKQDLKNTKSYPLSYYWCQNCYLLQQIKMAAKEELFNDRYTYMTGASKPIIDHYKALANTIAKKVRSNANVFVIASNDGTEIAALQNAGFKSVIGIEPSGNLARISNENGYKALNEFFTEELSHRLAKTYGKADVIIANNVMAHIPEPEDMLRGIRNLIKEDGYISIEVHWLKSLVEKVEIDTLYAEHYFSWSVKGMEILANRCGLSIVEIEYLPQPQAGSLRYWLRSSANNPPNTTLINHFKDMEISVAINDIKAMRRLSTMANARRRKLVKLIRTIRKQGKTIVIWATPAKLSTILNFCNLTNRDIGSAYDTTPSKIGKYIPKAGIPIYNEALLFQDETILPADYILIGAWNFIEVAEKKFKWYVEKGGKLINPLDCTIIGDK